MRRAGVPDRVIIAVTGHKTHTEDHAGTYVL